MKQKSMTRLRVKLFSAVVAFGMVLSGIVPYLISVPTVQAIEQDNQKISAQTNDYNLADNIQDGVILHCFDWKYNDITAELPNIAAAGFTSVQTSPAQVGGGYGSWYWLYQPLGMCAGTNALGTVNDLKKLCTEADKYGIKVIVDVVANHLSGNHSNIQSDLKDGQYWHTYGSVSNWSDRYQVTHGDIGMKDLNSEHSYVQQVVANYIKELKNMGVDGIRWDAAKHISLPSEGCDFWSKVTLDDLYHYGEILVGPDDRSSGNESLMVEYTQHMSVTDSVYGTSLREAFANGTVPSGYGNWIARGVAGDKLVYWGESHDTWSNGDEWGNSNGMSQNVIDRAYAIAASRDDATALYFSRPASKIKDSIHAGQKGSTHFTSTEVAAVNHFHNDMLGQAEYYTTGSNCAVVNRTKGAVVVAGSGGNLTVTVPNGGGTTQAGVYYDIVSGEKWTVTSTNMTGKIGATGIAVLYRENMERPDIKPAVGNKLDREGTVYYQNTSNWSSVYAYYWSDEDTTMTKWPGVKATSVGSGVYSVKLPAGAQYVIFSNGSGEQTDDLFLSGADKIYKNGSWSDYGKKDDNQESSNPKETTTPGETTTPKESTTPKNTTTKNDTSTSDDTTKEEQTTTEDNTKPDDDSSVDNKETVDEESKGDETSTNTENTDDETTSSDDKSDKNDGNDIATYMIIAVLVMAVIGGAVGFVIVLRKKKNNI